MPSEAILLRSILPNSNSQSGGQESVPICDYLQLCSNWHLVQALHYLTKRANQTKDGHINLLESKMSYLWRQIKLESK